MKNEIFKLLSSELSDQFALEKHNLPSEYDFEEQLKHLRKFLIERIDFLIVKDFERFMNTLYRIDVAEDKVKFAFSKNNDKPVGEVLADLIIERQIQRIKTRVKYKNQAGKERNK